MEPGQKELRKGLWMILLAPCRVNKKSGGEKLEMIMAAQISVLRLNKVKEEGVLRNKSCCITLNGILVIVCVAPVWWHGIPSYRLG